MSSIFQTGREQFVRITLLNSGLSPPIFILSNFTDPPWEPHEMKWVAKEVVDSRDPTILQEEYMFWRRFDINPGVWKYRYRVGYSDWSICDHHAEQITDLFDEDGEYNVLRVHRGGPAFSQYPAPLPIVESASNQDPRRPARPSSSDSAWLSDSSSPASIADGEQPLLGNQDIGMITESRSTSGREVSVESKDQEGFFAVSWKYFIAWIHFLLAKMFGRFSNA